MSTDDLTERAGFPVTIAGTAQNDPTATFNSTYQLQRPGLLLMNGVVYAGFGAHCDIGPYRGWIIGVTTAGVIRTMYSTVAELDRDPRQRRLDVGRGARLRRRGADPVLDGQRLRQSLPELPFPATRPRAISRTPSRASSLQADGSLKTTDFFAPFNADMLDHGDLDLGSGGVVALPPQFGTAAIPHLAVVAGKAGIFYLLNRDNLGGFQQGPGGTDAALTVVPLGGAILVATGRVARRRRLRLRHGRTAGPRPPVSTCRSSSTEPTRTASPRVTIVGKAPENFGSFSGSPIVTSNGTASGSALVWMTNLTAELRVYDAVPVNGDLNLRFRDALRRAGEVHDHRRRRRRGLRRDGRRLPRRLRRERTAVGLGRAPSPSARSSSARARR